MSALFPESNCLEQDWIIMNMKLPRCLTFAIDLIFYLYFNKLEALIYSKHWPPICQVWYKLFPASHLSVFYFCRLRWQLDGRFSILLWNI